MNDLPDARQGIGWQEEHAPLLVLPDMHMLVLTQCDKPSTAGTQNDMANCHGATATRPKQSCEEATCPTTMKLSYARHEAQPATKAQHGKTGQRAERGVWRCPYACDETGHDATGAHLRSDLWYTELHILINTASSAAYHIDVFLSHRESITIQRLTQAPSGDRPAQHGVRKALSDLLGDSKMEAVEKGGE
jgi:hypothetical protein